MKKEAKPELKSAETWNSALELAKKDTKEWETKGDKIVKRYRDERGLSADGAKRYNILWSNIQTLFPAVYSRKPKAQCDRRYKDKDPVGRTAAQILERALQYEIDHYNDYDASIRNALRDRLLPGRGVAWVRYEQVGQLTDDVEVHKAQLSDTPTDTTAEIADYSDEYSPCDYVFWKDFRHSPARTWEEVTWGARRVYLEKEAGIKRFGDEFKNVPLSHEPIGLDDMDIGQKDQLKKAIVWEIWEKTSKKVIWIAENYAKILDEKEDPLQLDCFFPFPKPLFATLTTDTLIPIADYLLYQDQARELDDITDRIGKLVEACKVVGVYDSSQVAIKRILDEGTDNTMIPVDNWAMFGEKGGLKGSVDWLPLDMVAATLGQMYEARDQTIQVIYAVTGLSDIVRGATQASETATAQQIKSNFASLRLKEIQNSVAMFASELLNIKAQIMCQYYKPETLVEMSGIMGTDDAQFVQGAIELLKNGTLRDFRIEVASDSLVELDERGEQESRTQFLAAVGGFLQQAVQAPPELAPLMGEMLLFGVRGFKVGRDIENAFDEAMAKLKEPKPPAADPNAAMMQAEQMKVQSTQQTAQMQMQANAQSEQARVQADMQIEQGKAQTQMQVEQYKLQANQQNEELKRQHEMQIAQLKLEAEQQFNVWKAKLDAQTKISIAKLGALASADEENAEPVESEEPLLDPVASNKLENSVNELKQAMTGIYQAIDKLSKPKVLNISRDANGKMQQIIEG